MSKEVSEEVQTGALPDQDEVRGAVSEVSRGRQAFGTAGTRAAHIGRVNGNELSTDHAPTTAAIWNKSQELEYNHTYLDRYLAVL